MKLIKTMLLLYALAFSVVHANQKIIEADSLILGKPGSSAVKTIEYTGKDNKLRIGPVSAAWEFTNDNVLWKKIGAGGGGGSAGLNALKNAAFEDGFSSNWTCTSTKCSEETTLPLNGEKSLTFTPTIQNDEFKSTLITISAGLIGRACEARPFYKGGDSELSFKVVNGLGEILAEEPLKSHSIAGFESLFFLCPNQADIDGNSLKGDLELVVFNKTTTAAVSADFDDMYLGNLIGLSEMVLPDISSGKFAPNGGAIISQSGNAFSNPQAVSTGITTIDIVNLGLTVPPSVSGVTDLQGGGISTTQTATQITIKTTSSSNVLSNVNYSLMIQKQGVDAKQAVQVYSSVPKISEYVNTFSADISSSGVVSGENVEFINGNCAVSGTSNSTKTCDVSSLSLAYPLACTASSSSSNATIAAYSASLTSNVFRSRDVSGSDSGAAFSIVCQKSSSDFKMPTQNIVLVNQVSTSTTKGLVIERCRVYNSISRDAATIAGTGCEAWVASAINGAPVGDVIMAIKPGVFSSVPHCYPDYIGVSEYLPRMVSEATDTLTIRMWNLNQAKYDKPFSIICIGER